MFFNPATPDWSLLIVGFGLMFTVLALVRRPAFEKRWEIFERKLEAALLRHDS